MLYNILQTYVSRILYTVTPVSPAVILIAIVLSRISNGQPMKTVHEKLCSENRVYSRFFADIKWKAPSETVNQSIAWLRSMDFTDVLNAMPFDFIHDTKTVMIEWGYWNSDIDFVCAIVEIKDEYATIFTSRIGNEKDRERLCWERFQSCGFNDATVDRFNALFHAVNMIALETSERRCSDQSLKLLQSVRGAFPTIDDGHILNLVMDARDQKSSAPLDALQKEYGSVALSPREKKRMIRVCLTIDPIDLLCALCNDDNNDIVLENTLAYDCFKRISMENMGKHMAIVANPSPYFVRKWRSDRDLMEQETVFLVNEEFLDFYRKMYYLPTIRNKKVLFTAISKGIPRYPGKTVDILLFENKEPYDQLALTAQTISSVSAFCSSGNFEKGVNGSHPIWGDLRFQTVEVQIPPRGINMAAYPRKKLLVKLIPKGSPNFTGYTITAFGLHRADKQYLVPRPIEVRGSDLRQDLADRKISLRQMVREAEFTRETRRNQPELYHFSSNLMICYLTTIKEGKCRIEAAFRWIKQNGKCDKLVRGSRKVVTDLPEDAVEQWLVSEFPFASISRRDHSNQTESVRSVVAAKLGERINNPSVELKTVWYLSPQIEEPFSVKDKEHIRKIMQSPIGELRMNDSAEEYWNAIQTYGALIPSHVILLLKPIIVYAIDRGIINHNVFSSPVFEMRRERNRIQEVRDALRRSSLSEKELITCYKAIKSHVEAGERNYAAVLLRLLTGLSPNIISALTWQDVTKDNAFGTVSISIRRQATNSGDEIRAFQSRTLYRSVPCMSIVADLLVWLFANRNLVVNSNTIFSDENGNMVPPQKFEEMSKSILEEIGISDDIIEIPDDGGGTVETNLARGRFDLFRDNFEYYLLNFCGVDSGECAHLLGRKADYTLASNYIDYNNPTIALIMQRKLDRLADFLQKKGGKKIQNE